MLVNVLKEIAKALMVSLLTEKFIKEVIMYALKKLAKRTDNQVDDEVVAMVDKALHPEPAQK